MTERTMSHTIARRSRRARRLSSATKNHRLLSEARNKKNRTQKILPPFYRRTTMAILSLLRRSVTTLKHVTQKTTSCRTISSGQLSIERQTDDTRFESRPPKEELLFGTTMSDHMLVTEWNQDSEWSSPSIVPYQDLKLSPASSCLHYGK